MYLTGEGIDAELRGIGAFRQRVEEKVAGESFRGGHLWCVDQLIGATVFGNDSSGSGGEALGGGGINDPGAAVGRGCGEGTVGIALAHQHMAGVVAASGQAEAVAAAAVPGVACIGGVFPGGTRLHLAHQHAGVAGDAVVEAPARIALQAEGGCQGCAGIQREGRC